MLLRISLLLSVVCSVDSWWMLSESSREQFASRSPTACNLVPGLSGKQRELCAHSPDAMKYVVDGLRMAIEECQLAFKDQVWNCSLTLRGVGTSPLKLASKESAYVYAISSAGVSHSLARACAKGLVSECGCGAVPSANARNFIWSGCSDNVRFGNAFGRKFIDANDKMHGDARSLMNLHNNKVGRRLLANAMTKQCKCHGVSGSCVTKTCWKVVPRFDQFASMLREKYELAQQVTAAPHGTALMVRMPTSGKESGRTERYLKEADSSKVVKNELVFLDASPDYCNDSRGRGQLDSRGRECGDHCQQICCGRGWHTVRTVVDEPCHCQFIWCCEVKCKTCQRVVDKNYCR